MLSFTFLQMTLVLLILSIACATCWNILKARIRAYLSIGTLLSNYKKTTKTIELILVFNEFILRFFFILILKYKV